MDNEVFIVARVFFSIIAVIKIATEASFRRKLLDKGLNDESLRVLYANTTRLQSASSLKWGMVLVGMGAALLIGQLFPHYVDQEVTIGLMFLFAGIGFLVYYPVAAKMTKNSDPHNPNRQP